MPHYGEQYEPNEVWIDGNEATSRTFERLIDVLLESEVTVNEPTYLNYRYWWRDNLWVYCLLPL